MTPRGRHQKKILLIHRRKAYNPFYGIACSFCDVFFRHGQYFQPAQTQSFKNQKYYHDKIVLNIIWYLCTRATDHPQITDNQATEQQFLIYDSLGSRTILSGSHKNIGNLGLLKSKPKKNNFPLGHLKDKSFSLWCSWKLFDKIFRYFEHNDIKMLMCVLKTLFLINLHT